MCHCTVFVHTCVCPCMCHCQHYAVCVSMLWKYQHHGEEVNLVTCPPVGVCMVASIYQLFLVQYTQGWGPCKCAGVRVGRGGGTWWLQWLVVDMSTGCCIFAIYMLFICILHSLIVCGVHVHTYISSYKLSHVGISMVHM